MRVFVLFALIFVQSLNACEEPEQTAEIVFMVDGFERFHSINSKGEFISDIWVGRGKGDDKGDDSVEYYYSNIDMNGDKINITKVIEKKLIDLGYRPVKVGNSINFNVGVAYPTEIDEYGNVLIEFSYDGGELDEGGCHYRKLGVWQKDRGFRVLDVPAIGYCWFVSLKDDRLIVIGRNKDNKNVVFVLSIKDGYFGERKVQQEVTK